MQNNYRTDRRVRILVISVVVIIFGYGMYSSPPVSDVQSKELELYNYGLPLGPDDLEIINQAIRLDQTESIRIIGAPGSIIEDLFLQGANITLIDSPGSIIRNNQIIDVNGMVSYGIYLENSDSTQIINNTISKVSTTEYAYGIFSKLSNNLHIEGNLIEQISSSNEYAAGISVTNFGNHTIVDNEINGVYAYDVNGIYTNNLDNPVTISMNTITEMIATNKANGIYVQSSGMAHVEHNSINLMEGIILYGILTEVAGAHIIGNIISSFAASSSPSWATGIHCSAVYSIINGNTVEDFTSYESDESWAVGIRINKIRDGDSATESNIIRFLETSAGTNAFSFGIMLDDCIGLSLKYNQITQLTAKDAGQTISTEYFSYQSRLISYLFYENQRGNITWTDDQITPEFYYLYHNNNLIDSDNWASLGFMASTKLLIDTKSLGNGLHQYSLVLSASGSPPAVDTIIVEILPTNTPTLVYGEDMVVPFGLDGSMVEWIFTDDNPDRYELYLNNDSVAVGSWDSEVPITYSLDGLAIGTYNFTITVYDKDGHSFTSTILVYVVEDSVPTMTNIEDYSIEAGMETELLWFAYDDYPGNFSIYLDNASIIGGEWNTSAPIHYIFDKTSVGLYNITIVVFDQHLNVIWDTVWIEVVDSTAPSLKALYLQEYEQELDGYNITWKLHDYHAHYYFLYENDIILANGTWDQYLEMNYSVDALPYGHYNLTLLANDTLGNINVEQVFFFVNDTMVPRIANPGKISFEEGLSDTLDWAVFDENPYNYSIYVDGYYWSNGTWSTINPISFDVSSLKFGLYNISLLVMDAYNNSIRYDTKVNIYVPPNHTHTLPDHETEPGGGSILGDLLDNPTYTMIGGAVIGVASVAYMFARRRG